jgi:2,4-dienoyl-CoA reductase-like NADH-dependent reductase (Old Yellow Enzyme family)
MALPSLFTPLSVRGLTLRNRIAISPMCQYSSDRGLANNWHLVHLGKFAQGGAAVVFAEATAVEERGRITHGDLGIWSDAHVGPLRAVADFIKSQGAIAAIQLSHAGRKGSIQRPWHGNGPLASLDQSRGEHPWSIVGPSAIPIDAGWLTPKELSIEDIRGLKQAWKTGAERALAAGFEIVEVHSAHGYLLHQFLSPLTNRRHDLYGGDLARRMQFPLEIVATVREVWPDNLPVFVRISAIDGMEGGWTLEDSVVFARKLSALGVDVVDCSSGGIIPPAIAPPASAPSLGFQVPFARRIKRDADIATMAVGLIIDPRQAEAIVQANDADLVAIGREALQSPNWPLQAAQALGHSLYHELPVQYESWLTRRAALLTQIRSNDHVESSRSLTLG